MFIQEDSLAQLQRALAAGDGPAAFRAAHSLKGNCMSLGFTRLQKAAEAIAEPLRVNRLEKALPLLAPLEEEYGRTVRTIRELNG